MHASPLPLRLPAAAIALLGGVGALLIGALAARSPMAAVALVAGPVVVALPWIAPATHLTLLLFVTAIVPFTLQNQFGIGGGAESPGLIAQDVLLISGMARGVTALLERPLGRWQRRFLMALSLWLLAVVVQFAHGYLEGNDLGAMGLEMRTLIGFGAFFIALPLLDDEATRERLLRGFVVVGILLGLWGIVQFAVTLPFSEAADVGVREGVDGTSSGRGSVQGGLYAFPIALTLAIAALVSGTLRTTTERVLVGLVVALNTISLLLTYERTLWVAVALAVGFIVLKLEPRARSRAIVLAPVAAVSAIGALAVIAPNEVFAAYERFASAFDSLGSYGTDRSLRYRLVESEYVLREIHQHPWVGNGLGASIFWGRPWDFVPPETWFYSHNGYLWLIWKIGLPASLLLWGVITVAILRRGRAIGSGPFAAVVIGAQAALLVVMVSDVTFPIFNSVATTATLGVLLALCAVPRAARPAS
jgi:O-antigen ligase